MNSRELYERAKKLMPGGVNSPIRAIDPYPFFIREGSGSKILDVDGNEYIDYCLAYGPLILGHKPSPVMKMIKNQLDKGIHFGAPCEAEIKLAEKIVGHVPSADMVRFVNSGTEATMNAIRLARAHTGREKILMFDGCYHGAHDHLLFKLGGMKSPGMPEHLKDTTIVTSFNNLASVEEIAKEEDLAAIITEPVIGNSGCIPPVDGFLEGLKEVCDENDILLIFDEVITGFRLSLGGAQEYYGVKPDLTTLGKIIGGGFPIGAFSGPEEIMRKIEPEGDVYHAGTFSGHPISMAAGATTLRELERKNIIGKTTEYAEEIAKILHEGSGLTVNQVGPMLQIFFTTEKVTTAEDVRSTKEDKFKKFWSELLKRNLFVAPARTECWFISNAHTSNDLEVTRCAIGAAFDEMEID